MSDVDPSPNPIPFAEVLAEELRSFGHQVPAPDPAMPPAEHLREVHAAIREEQPERSALCVSGGGIRSATFALGVVQALAKAGLLKQFDYLSTVSGGGYLGSFLSAWIHSHPQGLDGVSADLAGTCARSPTEPEARPLRHLREFSNYLSPKLGLFSADGWTLVATALRNLLLNWTVIVLILAGLLTLPWIGLLVLQGRPTLGQLHALLVVAFFCFAAATAYPGLDLPSLGNFRWRQSRFLLGWILPLMTGVLCLVAWWAGYTITDPDARKWLVSTEGQWKVAGFLMGFSLAGSAVSLVIAVPQQLRSGVFRERATFRHWWKVGVTMLAAVGVIGVPGAAMLWWLAAELFLNPFENLVLYLTCAPAVLLLGFFLLNSLFIGVTSWITNADDREWWARAVGWGGAITLGWLVVHILVFWVPKWIEIYLGPALQASVAASGGILGFIAAKLGASDKTSAILSDSPGAKKNLLLTGAAVVFFALLSCGVTEIVDRVIFYRTMLPWVKAMDAQEKTWRDQAAELVKPPAAPLTLTLPLPGLVPLVEESVFAQTRLEIRQRTLPDFGEVYAPWLAALENRKSFDPFLLLMTDPFEKYVEVPLPDDWIMRLLRRLAKNGDPYWTFAAGLGFTLVALLGGGLVMGCFVNVNRFSLHATYRNRLVRAYLGAARAFAGEDGRPLRRPHLFTGFDPDDDIRIAALDHPRPLHVVNMTLNLVGGDELAWQERKAESFTATRLHCGCARGYRPSAAFSGGLRLGTALAISGAAANPNQGYNSSAIITFVMTLFNVRLGWWLGNPARPGSHAWQRRGPRHAAAPLFIEAFGLTNESRDFVNLSDGGHFENLAIYEMLRRRCRYIVVIDAECDPGYAFDGLGGVVRKARVDMGIGITFLPGLKPEAMKKTRTAPGSYFALGEIDYKSADPAAENGLLLYLKPVLTGGEPTDVQHYARTSKDFPHETTGDQFFGESQFESYRALGFHEMTSVLNLQAPGSIRALVENARAQAPAAAAGQ